MSTSPEPSFLTIYGKTLAGLLSSARSGESSTTRRTKAIRREVQAAIDQLLKAMTKDQPLFVEESWASVFSKLESILEEFIKFDNNHVHHYKKLIDTVKSFKSMTQSPSSNINNNNNDNAAVIHFPSEQPGKLRHDSSEPAYETLSEKEKQCLLWFCLLPDGVGISRTDLIYMWDLEDEGHEMLDKLINTDFIERLVLEKKMLNVFKMRSDVRSKLKELAAQQSWPQKAGRYQIKEDCFGVIHVGDNNDKLEPEEPGEILAILNTASGRNSLNAAIFDGLSKMKNVKVVYLGLWNHGADNNIVVEDDVELGKALKQMVQMTCLSLQGVSGIVQLPDLICRLDNLRILDLRGCNNLELLPQGIGSLRQLTHLDLTDCHLLSYVPDTISDLSDLRVLKGFIINPEPEVQQQSLTSVQGPSLSMYKGLGQFSNILRRPCTSPRSCEFSHLSKLKKLRKLTVRTRRMNFPMRSDLQTLCELQELNNLKITWVGSSTDAPIDDGFGKFPESLQKLELQAVPSTTASNMLGLISNKRYGISLKKLYIRGGLIRDLELEKHKFFHVKEVRLRYLPNLRTSWHQFIQSFPDLTRLEILRCPKLIFFPCDDNNGVWEHSKT